MSLDVTDLELARDLRLAVGRFSRRARRLFVEGGQGLGFLELGILDRIHRDGVSSPGRLSQGEGVTGPAVAETLRRLESDGFVGRTRDPDDGRRVVVTLTDAGRASLDDRDRAVLGRIQDALARLDDDERAALAAVLPLLEKVASDL